MPVALIAELRQRLPVGLAGLGRGRRWYAADVLQKGHLAPILSGLIIALLLGALLCTGLERRGASGWAGVVMALAAAGLSAFILVGWQTFQRACRRNGGGG
jgi:hypothetical protein